MKLSKNMLILTPIAVMTAASALAGVTPQETNRQITRGNGTADHDGLVFRQIETKRMTPALINRHARTASQKDQLLQPGQSRSANRGDEKHREKTPFLKNRKS